MRRFFIALGCCFALTAGPIWAAPVDLKAIVDEHILPGYAELAQDTETLATTAQSACGQEAATLETAYHDAFDAWVRVSHVRFGPSEVDTRAFALAYWPDSRGATPKALAELVRAQDPAVADPAAFAEVSVAARGFYALEFLLFDPQFTEAEPTYLCALIQAISTDMAANAAAIHTEWQERYGALVAEPGNDLYRTADEAARQIFTALSTGLEFTANMRLGRPLGTFERPRPLRAEARRSGRSLRHVQLSLEATQELAGLISGGDAAVAQAYETALRRAETLEDPVFAGVATPAGRLRVEVLQQNVEQIRALLASEVGPSLGIAAGFNALDGD